MPRAARTKAINALATNVTKRVRKQVGNAMMLVQTPQRKDASRSKSKGRNNLLGSNQWNSTYTKSTMLDTGAKDSITTQTTIKENGKVFCVLDLSKVNKSRKTSRQRTQPNQLIL